MRALIALMLLPLALPAQQRAKPEDTEVWSPEPKIITPGVSPYAPPSDAIILFDGKNLNAWTSTNQKQGGWIVADGIMTVDKKAGDLRTKRNFNNYQLHIEWLVPSNITGSGQGRGNSGVYLAQSDSGGYELQILDSYENKTYVNGQAAAMYKQSPPLVNAMRRPGEWQTYDVVWTAPVFNADGSVKSAARVTAFHNGVLVQNNYALTGTTEYIGKPRNVAHGPSPIMLQSHGDASAPVSFRNIWLRELP